MSWVSENIDRDWSKVIYSDEATFWMWVRVKRAWSIRGRNFMQRIVQWKWMSGDASRSADPAAWSFSPRIWVQRRWWKFTSVASLDRPTICLVRLTKIGSYKKIMIRNIVANSAKPGRRKMASLRWIGPPNLPMPIPSKMCRALWRPSLQESLCTIWSSLQKP